MRKNRYRLSRIIGFFLTIFLFLSIGSLLKGNFAHAAERMGESSAMISFPKKQIDHRKEKLENFLRFYESPLAPYASYFIKMADRYLLDWKLLPAISGVESSYGKMTPLDSYNAYGWNNGRYCFKDWPEGIETLSKGLRENYIDRGAITLEQIGTIYAESPTWAERVKSNMEEIENFTPSSLQFSL